MRKFIYTLFVFVFLSSVAFGQTKKDYSLGKVQKFSGRYVFINTEPVNEYDIAFQFKAVAISSSQISGITKLTNFCMKKAVKESNNLGGKDFDAIIITGGSKYDIAIKFK